MISFDNIKKIALWDLTINRSMYRKQIYSLLAFFGALLFIHLVPQLWSAMLYGADSVIGNYSSMLSKDHSMAQTLFFTSFVVFMLWQSNFLSVLRTKQGRINEFMIPASNGERFIWRAFVSTVVTALVIIVGIECYDLIQMLVHTIVFKGYEVHSVWTLQDLDIFINSSPADGGAFTPAFIFFMKLATVLSIVAFSSTYFLGSTIKYKKTLLWTTLFHFLFWMTFSLLMMLIATSEAGGLLERLVRFLFENRGILSWIKDYPWVISFTGCLIESLLIAWMWCRSYKNYCRAQLTTRMNP